MTGCGSGPSGSRQSVRDRQTDSCPTLLTAINPAAVGVGGSVGLSVGEHGEDDDDDTVTPTATMK